MTIMKVVTIMDRLFLSILNMSLTGAFVILAICLIRLPLKRVPKIISYCLWIVAGFRLIIPFSIESSFSLIPFRARSIPTNIASQTIPQFDSGITAVDNFVNNTAALITPPVAPPIAPEVYISGAANPGMSLVTLGAYIWLLGAVVMLIYGVVSYMILKRKLRGSTLIENNIYEAENIKSPFVLGIIRPEIFLPTGLSADEYEYIVLHEQVHIRRRDHVVKFAAYFILALHWFNPLAWVAFLMMSADMEMSCDERVLKELKPEVKAEYSRSLVAFTAKRQIIGTSPLAFGEGGMKERVKNVLKFKKHSRIAVAIAAVLVVALSIGLTMNRAAPDVHHVEDPGIERPDEAQTNPFINNDDVEVEVDGGVVPLDDILPPVIDGVPPVSYEPIDNIATEPMSLPQPDLAQWSWSPSLLSDVGTLLHSRPPGGGWVLSHTTRGQPSRVTGIHHPNNVLINYWAWHGSWGYEEEAVLLESTQLLFDYFGELREVIFQIFVREVDESGNLTIISGELTATRDAFSDTGQWCLEDRYSREIGDGFYLDSMGRLIFQWMPEGYDFDTVYTFVDSLPLPDSNWHFISLSIGDTFLEYGSHVYSMAISYNVSSDGSLWWLTSAAEEVLMANAAQMFEHFEDLLIIYFSMFIRNNSGDTEEHFLTVHRENIA